MGDFYQVYFVSAAVIVVAPIYNYLSDRMSWRRLIPATAAFFAASMVVFRLLYQPDTAWFGLVFYGWYDLLAASLVTQFYIATQIFYNARDAKRAYPVVIAAGSGGATLGASTHVLWPGGGGSENLAPGRRRRAPHPRVRDRGRMGSRSAGGTAGAGAAGRPRVGER